MESEVRTEPWLTKDALSLMKSIINKQSDVLEFGAGGSTVWLSGRVGKLITIEHDPEWVNKVRHVINQEIDLRLFESRVIQGTDHLEQPYDHVCEEFADDSFDFVLVDGRDRVKCVSQAMRLVRPGGYICVDNMERPSMHEIYDILKEWNLTSTSQTDCIEAQECGVWKTDFWKKPYDLKSFKQQYSWPERKPDVPEDDHSLFCNEEALRPLLQSNMNVIVELGSWLGASTRFILSNAENALVIAVDHWEGSAEHQTASYAKHRLKTLYETFLVNCWDYRERLIPVRETTLKGLETIALHNILPDLIYVDASHKYEDVIADLEMIHSLFPKTQIVGDDWQWEKTLEYPVRRAVNDFALKNNFKIFNSGNCWWLRKKRWLLF